MALPSGGGSSAGSFPLCGSPVGGVLSPVVFLFPVTSVPRLASRSCSRSCCHLLIFFQVMGQAREMHEELSVKEMEVLDLSKRLAETGVRLRDFSKLYEMVKGERNK